MEHYFGPVRTLEELVERGQLLQCEGYKFIFEEARRQKPVCSMALNWCYKRLSEAPRRAGHEAVFWRFGQKTWKVAPAYGADSSAT